jgi:hypothetical protein
MDSLFSNELQSLRWADRFLAEVGGFACKPGYKGDSMAVVMHLMKQLLLYSRNNLHVEDLVITVNPKHALFYKAVWLFEPL